MRNKIIILSLSLVMVLCSSFSVFASTVFYSTMTEPSTSDTQGYLALYNGSVCRVLYWSIQPISASAADNRGAIPSMNLIINDDSVTFTALYTGTARVTLTRVNNSSAQVVEMSNQFTSSSSFTYNWSGMTHYAYKGNIGVVDDNMSSSNNYLTVYWGNDNTYQEAFDELINELVDIDTRLLNISSSVDGLEGKLDNINSTLTRIRDYVDTLESQLNTISGDISTIKNTLNTVNSRLETALSRLNTIISNQETMIDNQELMVNELQLIREAISYSVEDVKDAPYVDNRPFFEFDSAEDNVLEDNSSAVADLKLEFGNGFNVVWDLISQAWQTNAKVFTVVIMCLTIGVIKLVFNR